MTSQRKKQSPSPFRPARKKCIKNTHRTKAAEPAADILLDWKTPAIDVRVPTEHNQNSISYHFEFCIHLKRIAFNRMRLQTLRRISTLVVKRGFATRIPVRSLSASANLQDWSSSKAEHEKLMVRMSIQKLLDAANDEDESPNEERLYEVERSLLAVQVSSARCHTKAAFLLYVFSHHPVSHSSFVYLF